jgi:hypothetical protein
LSEKDIYYICKAKSISYVHLMCNLYTELMHKTWLKLKFIFVCFCSLNRSSYLDKILCVLYLNYDIDNCSISYTLKTIIKLLLFYVKYYKEMKCLNHIFSFNVNFISTKTLLFFFLCVLTGIIFFFIIVDMYMYIQRNLAKPNYLPWTKILCLE